MCNFAMKSPKLHVVWTGCACERIPVGEEALVKIDVTDVFKELERRARLELAKPKEDPTHPTDRASALRIAANHFRAIERNAEPVTVALSEVIADLEQEVQTDQANADLLHRIIAQLRLVDAL